ncbi:MAG: PfkB family carbohydrate kinase [Acidobacteriota bacterium]|nr:PfkB family carbohydrate kinase [Acidobacteriota bacterium]
MNPVLCFGEALIDFVPLAKGQRLADVDTFARVPGGAPANVAACVARLGGNVQFAGQVGGDAFGDCIQAALQELGVGTRWLRRTTAAKTALAFVTLSAAGERDFAFYRDPSADMLFSAANVEPEWFVGRGILHVGTVSLTHAESRAATERAVALARAAGWLVSFDPNARLDLWPSPEAFAEAAMAMMPFCDVVKLADDELRLLGGGAEATPDGVVLRHGPRAALITYGADGARLVTGTVDIRLSGLPVKVVDTTGAGDAFVGAFLFELARRDVTGDTLDAILRNTATMRDCLGFANACAAASVTRRGAIPAMPTRSDVHALMDMQR